MNQNFSPKRRRNIAVTIRMTPDEYAALKQKVAASGLSQQTCILNSIQNATVTSSDEVAALRDISLTFAELTKQLRGLATNVNQMAHIANGQGMLPMENTLNEISVKIKKFREEFETEWQSIRSLTNPRNRTEQ